VPQSLYTWYKMYNRLTDELAVCGLNAVRALSEVHPDKINRLFVREDRFKSFTGLCKRLAERKRPYKVCEDEELERICKTSHHQGIVAMIYEPAVEPAMPEDLDAWAAEGKTGLLLCNIGNDLNLGAIVRSAAFFDASPIVLAESSNAGRTSFASASTGNADRTNADSANTDNADRTNAASTNTGSAANTDGGNTAGAVAAEPEDAGRRLTTGAYRVAEGGMEYVNFRSVRNAAAFLRSASKQLITIGTDPRARIRIGDLPQLIKSRSEGKKPGILLVIGNEETGLSKEEKDNCSILARIPGTGVLDSLNAAQATALFLRELYERTL